MIPRVTSGGRSFKGAYQYYCHDKSSSSRDRVEWVHTTNLLTEDMDKAWKVMAYTALEQQRLKESSGQRLSGRKLEKPVFAYSLAWHPEQDPDKEEMLEAAQRSVQALGLTEHETMIIAHRDTPQKHVHIVINRVHPVTGIAGNVRNSKRKLSDFAREYEREHGKIYCQRREDNYRKRQDGEKTMYRDPNITEAWKRSENGKSFAAALREKGYHLAQGRKRVVIVDPNGRIHNPTKQIQDVKAKDIRERLSDLNTTQLPDADTVSKEITDARSKTAQPDRQTQEAELLSQRRLDMEHFEKTAELSSRHNERIAAERTRLTEFYNLPYQAKEIKSQRSKVKNHKWWQRLLGIAKRDRDALDALERSYGNAKGRFNDRIEFLEHDRTQALESLRARQAKEKHILKEFGLQALLDYRSAGVSHQSGKELETQQQRFSR